MPEEWPPRASAPRIFETLRYQDVAPGFWEYYKVDPARADTNPQGSLSRTVEALLRCCALRGRVLSVGCGYGLYEILLSFLGDAIEQVIGIDILDDRGSDEKIRSMNIVVQRVTPSRVSSLLADAGRLPFRNESFDCALAIDCLSHADYKREDGDLRESQRTLLVEMARVLRVGGLLAVLENNELSPTNVMRKHGTTCHPVNPSYLRSVLRRLGFANCRIVPYYDLAGRTDPKSRLAGALLRRTHSMGLFVAPWFILSGQNG